MTSIALEAYIGSRQDVTRCIETFIKSYLLKASTPAHDHKLSSETFRHQVLQYAELTGDFNPVHLRDGKSAINKLFLV